MNKDETEMGTDSRYGHRDGHSRGSTDKETEMDTGPEMDKG